MDFMALATECAPWVAPQTMVAIVRTESQFKPYAIGINGGHRLMRQPANKQEAVATAKWLIANHYNIDMGLGQVNSKNLTKTGLSVEDAFDPCRNLTAAGLILTWNFQSASRKHKDDQVALHAAISAYNTGSFTRGFSNGYVQKVMNNAQLVPTIASPPKLSTQGSGLIIPVLGKTSNSTPKKTNHITNWVNNRKSTPMTQQALIAEASAVDQGIMVYAD